MSGAVDLDKEALRWRGLGFWVCRAFEGFEEVEDEAEGD